MKQKSINLLLTMLSSFMLFFFVTNIAKAIDPPYQKEMARLTQILGSLYFLQPLCGFNSLNWHDEANELINLDKPDNDRKQRLIGAFNQGYQNYATSYNSCTPSANLAREQLLNEAKKKSLDIHTRFAE